MKLFSLFSLLGVNANPVGDFNDVSNDASNRTDIGTVTATASDDVMLLMVAPEMRSASTFTYKWPSDNAAQEFNEGMYF